MRREIEARIRTEDHLHKELERVRGTNRMLQQLHDAEITTLGQTHQRAQKSLKQRNMELRNTMRSLKVANTKLKKRLELERKASEEEREILRAKNKELQQAIEAMKDHLFFVMDYVSRGDLWDELSKENVFCEKRVQFYATEIMLALQFLHRRGIVLRDLKLENVLVDRDGHCKASDFGLSKTGVFHRGTASSHCGTPPYMAPEMLEGLPYGHSVDWWALGIMVFEMLTGSPRYDYDEHSSKSGGDDDDSDVEKEKLFHKILNTEVEYPDNMSLVAMSLVMKLLKKNPEERLGANSSVHTVRQHLFFKGIDWKALKKKEVKPPVEEKKPEGTFNKVLLCDSQPCTIDNN